MINIKFPEKTTATKAIAFTGLATAIFLAPNAAQAAIFTVGGTEYDLTTVTGSYTANAPALNTTPWWNNPTLAQQFATTVGAGLGFPNSTGILSLGPIFAYNTDVDGSAFFSFGAGGTVIGLTDIPTGASVTYAVQAVPEPLTIMGAIFAVGIGAGFKRKLAQSKDDN